jgi:hypothetical protein
VQENLRKGKVPPLLYELQAPLSVGAGVAVANRGELSIVDANFENAFLAATGVARNIVSDDSLGTSRICCLGQG